MWQHFLPWKPLESPSRGGERWVPSVPWWGALVSPVSPQVAWSIPGVCVGAGTAEGKEGKNRVGDTLFEVGAQG